MENRLRFKILKPFSTNIFRNLLWRIGRTLVIATAITTGSTGKGAWAQNFDIPEGYVSEIEYEETDAGYTITVLKIHPEKGNFTQLSSISLRPISNHIGNPTQWLRDRMRLVIDGDKWLEEIFDDPDSPFGGDDLSEMRTLLKRSLDELSNLAEWPLKYCDPVIQGDNPAGKYHQLVCRYSIATITQHLVLRLQQANGLWYQTAIRTMNERRLRHFIAIANSFHLD